MNGYELVRKQPQQDSEISKRLPLTGGTVHKRHTIRYFS